MKFDFVIGNPPYQDETIGENKGFAPPVYHLFLDETYALGDKVEMIHPARFLFNAGSTPKQWNEKMLNDKHFKVLFYEENADTVFPNTDIKGGITISYHDKSKEYEAVRIFTQYSYLNSILGKVNSKSKKALDSIGVSSYSYHFTDTMHYENPGAKEVQSKGHEYDLKSNIIEKLPAIFHDTMPQDGKEYIIIVGRANNERVNKFIRKAYINNVINLDKYKLFIPKASGKGAFGETLGSIIVAEPNMGYTETFFSIGQFTNEAETLNLLKYIKCKFSRALLSVLKKTQNVTPSNFKYVPLQDFTPDSDIDWSVSVADIDKQLYKKYGLSPEEIEFIETHVKEMV